MCMSCLGSGRSSHAKKLDPVLNTACRAISGCLKPTRVDDLYLLCGIAPPKVRREVSSRLERTKQEDDSRHPLFQHVPPPKRLKSRKSFLHAVQPLDGNPQSCRIEAWSTELQEKPHNLSFEPKESLPTGASEPWPDWLCLNRLRTGVGRCKALMQKWGYNLDGSTECDCGEAPQTMEHLLNCTLLPEPCTSHDLHNYSPRARACVLQWLGKV